jgi:alpha-galactosidase
MAASEAGKDYAHQLSAAIPGASHMEANVSGFEENYRAFDLNSLKEPLQSHPNLIVVELGDNVTDKSEFGRYYTDLIDYLGAGGNAFILCTSTWWGNRSINAAIRTACTRSNARYVDISNIYEDSKNRAGSERSITNSGVAEHPGDRGMTAIAAALYAALAQ